MNSLTKKRPQIQHPLGWGRLCLLLALLSLARGEQITELTLENAVTLAQENSPTSKIAEARVARAEAELRQARAGLFPSLDIGGGYQRTTSPLNAFGAILNREAFEPTLDFNDPGEVDDLMVGATLRYNLFDAGARRAGKNAAQYRRDAQRSTAQSARLELTTQVVNAWFQLQAAEKLLQANHSELRALEVNLDTARAKYRAGTFLKTEVLNLEVKLAQSQEELIRSEHGVRIAQRSLLNLMGLESRAAEGIRLVSSNPDPLQVPPPDTLAQRPELEALRQTLRSREEAQRQSAAGRYPNIHFIGQYAYHESVTDDGSGDHWTAGIGVRYPLFDGFARASREEKALAEIQLSREQLRQKELDIDFEIERARLQHREALLRLSVTEKVIEQAQESAELSRARFTEGLLLSSELIDVETALTNARHRRALAQNQERIATANLRRSLGLRILTTTHTDSTLLDIDSSEAINP